MSSLKVSKAEALKKTIDRSREEAVQALSEDEKSLYFQFLTGDRDALRSVQKCKMGSAIYDAANYALADHLDLLDTVRRLNLEVEAPAAPATLGFPGLPGLPGGSSNVAPVSQGVQESPSSFTDVIELLDAWKHRYGTQTGLFEQELNSAVINSEDKDLLTALIDRDILRIDSFKEVRWQDPSKTHLRQDAPTYKRVPMYEYLLASHVVPFYEILSEHAVGIEMFKKATDDLKYEALQFAFDTKHDEIFRGFLDTNIDLSDFREPKHNTPILCDFMYRAEEGDEPNLVLLVEYGASLVAVDTVQSTPLMVAARVGNFKAAQWLLQYDVIDIYAKNLMNDTVLSVVESGPARRKNDQEVYDEALEHSKEAFKESLESWEVRARAAEAAGKKPPDQPQEPQYKPRPDDYPLELIGLIQDAWMMGDPTQSKKAVDPQELQNTGLLNFDFDSF